MPCVRGSGSWDSSGHLGELDASVEVLDSGAVPAGGDVKPLALSIRVPEPALGDEYFARKVRRRETEIANQRSGSIRHSASADGMALVPLTWQPERIRTVKRTSRPSYPDHAGREVHCTLGDMGETELSACLHRLSKFKCVLPESCLNGGRHGEGVG